MDKPIRISMEDFRKMAELSKQMAGDIRASAEARILRHEAFGRDSTKDRAKLQELEDLRVRLIEPMTAIGKARWDEGEDEIPVLLVKEVDSGA